MEKDKAKQIIISILHKSLVGQLNTSSNFNPQAVADAIADKVNFEKSYIDTTHELFIKTVLVAKKEMEIELSKTHDDQTLLRNFINGKITAYSEILSSLKK